MAQNVLLPLFNTKKQNSKIIYDTAIIKVKHALSVIQVNHLYPVLQVMQMNEQESPAQLDNNQSQLTMCLLPSWIP